MTNLAAAVELSRERVIETVKHLQTTVRMFGEVRLSKDCGPFIDSLLAILQAETTRPPVAGLAELTDAMLKAGIDASMEAEEVYNDDRSPDVWEKFGLRENRVRHIWNAIEAAREFLGKVDGC